MSTEDIVAVEQLLYRYCHVVDRGTVEALAGLFHPTAVLLPVYESDKRYEGREAVLAWFANYHHKVRARTKFLRHKVESPAITVNGDRATSVCYFDADTISISTNEPIITLGRYNDKLIKDDGIWYIKERKILIYYNYTIKAYIPGRGEGE